MSCRGFLQCMLKFTNFLLALVGGFTVIYSLWMVKEFHDEFPPPSPSPPIAPPSPPPPPPLPVPPPARLPPPEPAPEPSQPAPEPPQPAPEPPQPAPEPPQPAPEPSQPAPEPSPLAPERAPPAPSPAPTPASTPPSPVLSPPSPPESESRSGSEPSPGSPLEPEPKPVPEPSDVAPGPDHNIAELGIKGSESVFRRSDQTWRPFLFLKKEKKVALPKWPEPWFIYAFLGVGVTTLLITCTGHIAAETSHNFCLSCYLCLQILLVIVHLILAGFLFFDKHWRQDLPDDPTGQLDNVENFIEENLDICKWVALGVLIVEALGLFFAMTLRAISADSRRPGYDSDEEYAPRQPLLNRQKNQGAPPSAAAPVGAGAAGAPPLRTAVRNDAWSARMREKYGLDTTEFTYNPEESRRFSQANQATSSTEDKLSCCSIM